MSSTRSLIISQLGKGLPGITKAWGNLLAQACIFCLDDQNHVSGVKLEVERSFFETFEVWWDGDVTDQMRRAWNDPDEATEYGATGIAILLILELTEFTIVKRSRKSTGFDHWLGHKGDRNLQEMGRLEISGLRKGKAGEINARVKDKIQQTDKSDHTLLPAYIVVVEFSRPVAHMVQK